MSGGNSAYSPLPQSNSDSEESSEELHIADETRVVNRTSRSQNPSPQKMFNGQNQNTVKYKLLHTDGDMEATFIRFQSASDEVSILKPSNKIEIFSTSRKICFSLSLLLCIFTTVIFIWFLPCNEGTSFSASNNRVVSWEHTLDYLELFGPIGVLSYSSDNLSLVFCTKISFSSFQDNINENNYKNNEPKYGLVSYNGVTGFERWNVTLNEEPDDLDCTMIDVNLDDKKDCLVLGHYFLKAIDSVTGKEVWDLEKSQKKKLKLYLIDFPVLIYDVNGDAVNDLITSCSLTKSKNLRLADVKIQNYLIIISGKTGEILNTPMQVTGCSTIHNITTESNSILSFMCADVDGKGVFRVFHLGELLATLDNYSNMENQLKISKWNDLYEHVHESNSVSINGYTVIVDNQGQCPGNCSVAVDIKNENIKDSNNNTVYTYNDRNTYCVLPTVLKSNSVKMIVLKFWKWESKNSVVIDGKKNKMPAKRTVSFQDENLYNAMLSESETELKRYKRGVRELEKAMPEMRRKPDSSDPNIYMHVISETLVAITFNRSHPFVRNITQNKLVQACRAQICEPDIYGQRQSLLTGDLNGNGEQEFVSFSSKYTHEGESWRLQSTIKALTL